MALVKRVKTGGSFFEGFKLVVSSGTGDYTQDTVLSNQGCAVNSVTITPTKFGDGDSITIQHLDVNGNVKPPRGTIASTIYNIGAGVSIMLDLSALEIFDANEKIRIIYTNVAGLAMNVYLIVERVR